MPEPQTYKNHTRLDPPWHFFIAPFLLLNVIFAIYLTVHHWPQHWAPLIWYVLLSIVLFFAVGKARAHSMVVQDRVIRLEEKLRYQALLSPDLLARSQALTVRQIIALRFASDAELPALVKRALDENLEPKQIKQSITTWRPDYLRV
jgi:Family of unknown function (DUF6526)